MGRLRRFVLICVATLSLVLMPVAANAFTLLQCNGNGGVASGTLFDVDPGDKSGGCAYSNKAIIQHVFSTVICNFVIILNDIMDGMYCGINYYLVNVVSALLTLYLVIYGAQIVMGSAQFSTRDGIIRMLKISFIYVFATDATYGINYIFGFFVGFISDASAAILNVLSSNVGAQSDGTCNFDGMDSDISSMYNFLDYLVCHAFIGTVASADTRIQGLMLAMIVALPPMMLMFQWWLMTTLELVKNVLIGFLKAVAIIAFLVTLSPVFLGFFLFQSTAYLFENWLRYLIAFSVQIVLIIAIVVFWIMLITQFINFFNDLSKLIFPFEPVQAVGGIWSPSNGWGICPATYGTDATGAPAAACKSGFNAFPPNWCTDHSICEPREWNNSQAAYAKNNPKLIPPAEIINQGEFLYYIFYHLITLLLISYAFSELLGKADEIARSLSGPSSVPSLLPGFGKDLGNVNSFERPSFVGNNASGGKSASNLAANFHKLVGNR